MTTFNELLGTKSNDSEAVIKQRYKLLSHRVHPDKGGSKALMQLVHHAYDNVSKGKGDNYLTPPASISMRDSSLSNLELQKITRERDELNALNQLLKAQLAQAQASSKKQYSGSNAEYERKIAKLEGELVLLKDERNRLKAQKEDTKNEKNKLAADLKRALSENEVLETELDNAPSLQLAAISSWTKRIAMPLIVTLSLVGAGVYGVNKVNWLLVKSWFVGSPPPPPAPALKVVHAVEKKQEDQAEVEQDDVVVSEDFDTGRMPFLQLTKRSGSWSLAAYTESEQPYIAIRSDNGSYIVNDCSGAFTLYLNEQYRPLRVAANLIYMHQNQHFYVYKIPYGQGSSPESWLQSRRLKINDEYFTSDDFGANYNALVDQCQNIS
ncbi:hypothetical protein LRP49_16605 [Enterovibrio sp. ZSDZ35]|uniref:J domain-containing protein n=1 Tax=Enterovibrio qingdaonensis TaxID=2899818 RepID=A0ABT5QP81_9GAMM|nr:hypothetical protein [Enterovibrio sp. ZSDZ35]MDD1782796.1 hypothetical protein [Enterovibrio sp. ZSDZ35]